MRPRRVVTGNDGSGKSRIVADGLPPRHHDFSHIPGHSSTVVWSTTAGEPRQVADPTETLERVVPGPDSTVMLVVSLPPDSVWESPKMDHQAALAEQAAISPGLIEAFEPDAPGFHTTPTVDYFVILEGELILELDDGSRTPIEAHDIVVQDGTRHAWRNVTDRPVTFVCVFVGRR